MHALVFAAIIYEFPNTTRFETPPAVPVELVSLPPPPPVEEEQQQEAPEPEPEPEPEEQAEPEMPEPKVRQSGATDNTELPAGELPETQVSEEVPEPAKPEESPQEVEKVAEPAPEVPELPESETGTEPKAPEQAQAFAGVPELNLPPAYELPMPTRGMSGISGGPGGGGDPYLNALRDKIIAHIVYPPGSESRRGVARYQAIITRNGQLAHVELVKSSGHRDLDQVGLRAIRTAAPFKRLPGGIPGDRAVIEISLRLGS